MTNTRDPDENLCPFSFRHGAQRGVERKPAAERIASPARGSRDPRPLGSPASGSGRGDERDARKPHYDQIRWWVPRTLRLEAPRQAGRSPFPQYCIFERFASPYAAASSATGSWLTPPPGPFASRSAPRLLREMRATGSPMPRWNDSARVVNPASKIFSSNPRESRPLVAHREFPPAASMDTRTASSPPSPTWLPLR